MYLSASMKPWSWTCFTHETTFCCAYLTDISIHLNTWNMTSTDESNWDTKMWFLNGYWIFECNLLGFLTDTARYHTFHGKFFKLLYLGKSFAFACVARKLLSFSKNTLPLCSIYGWRRLCWKCSTSRVYICNKRAIYYYIYIYITNKAEIT